MRRLTGKRGKILLLAALMLAAGVAAALFLGGKTAGQKDGAASGDAETDELSSEAAQILSSSGGALPAGVSSEDMQSYTVDKPLKTASSQLMESYDDRGDCVLLEAQYLDLLGKVWGFSVEGQGWADVCILKETGSRKTEVEIVHLTAERAEEAEGS